MTYFLRLGRTEPEQLPEALTDPRLASYKVVWANEDQREALLYLPAASTRGVSLKWLDGDTLIRLHTLASPADWLIGIRLATVLAGLTGRDVSLEPEGLALDAADFARRCDAEWLAPRCHLGTELLQQLVLGKGETASVQGWSDVFHIGPWLFSELGIDGGTESELAYVLLIKRMRSHQQLAADADVHRPTGMVLAVPTENEEPDIELCCASLPPQTRIWVDSTFLDCLGLWPQSRQIQGLDPLWFPSGRLPELLGAHCRRLDEQVWLVQDLTDEEISMAAEQVLAVNAQTDLPEDYRRVRDFFAARVV
ncbi:MAG: hypothetical protein ACAI44_19110 [Candidatus Sericytochromatia bacterium]